MKKIMHKWVGFSEQNKQAFDGTKGFLLSKRLKAILKLFGLLMSVSVQKLLGEPQEK